MLFEPDLFSSSRPGWSKIEPQSMPSLNEVLSFLPKEFLRLACAPEQSSALGINSSNFRLTTTSGVFVLKQWSIQATVTNLENTLELMVWLSDEQLPLPTPIRFQNGSFLLSLKSRLWSLFPFIEGEYFSGSDGQLCAAAEVTGRLMKALSRLPSSRHPTLGPAHLSLADGELLIRIQNSSQNWTELFGFEYAKLLTEFWPTVMAEWTKLSFCPPITGPVQAVHYDLHPHNILVSGNKVAAVLDFEACELMPLGYALAFAALKQCRQAMVTSYSHEPASAVGALYSNHLILGYPEIGSCANNFGDLAVGETLRRICLILRLNLEQNEQQWNRILPVQLRHLIEARALFG